MTTPTPPNIHEIQDLGPHEIADRTSLPVIYCDHQATRRQRIHGVTMPHQSDGYSSTHLIEVLEYLGREGFDTAVFLAETPSGALEGALCRFIPLDDRTPEIDPDQLQ